MSVTTILVESDQKKLQEWTDYVTEYDRETSKTSSQDLTGLGTPSVAAGETLEGVLDLMGQGSSKIALIFAHASPHGLIMRITANANSAQSKYVRGISRAWKAIDEIIKLRSGRWPASGKPEFLIDVPGAVKLFQSLLEYLRGLSTGYAGRLSDPTKVANREQADAWFDQWMDLMAKACLGGGLGESDLRRVCRAMQKVRDAHYERVEIRACNIGKDKENLNALKEFFGAGQVIAPKITMFFGRAAVNLPLPGQRGDLDQLVKDLGGFRGSRFTPAGKPNQHLNQIVGGEPELHSGKRNRIFPETGPAEAIMQMTEMSAFHYKGRLFSKSAPTLTKFLQANYKSGYSFTPGKKELPVGGMWTAGDPTLGVPFILPLEAKYRDLLETSD